MGFTSKYSAFSTFASESNLLSVGAVTWVMPAADGLHLMSKGHQAFLSLLPAFQLAGWAVVAERTETCILAPFAAMKVCTWIANAFHVRLRSQTVCTNQAAD
jgi:hypothetical protein